ncbi:MAG: phosphonate metabolism protein/1,5-bisphosphokinase (PRPP-forming) PhnN [Rhodobacteraceae bacterium]|nr:phosphonate metabolism protein/1,5-bisphosphokinase (PRPP-forming) PhnN [Paracoccaceae bacterium]
MTRAPVIAVVGPSGVGKDSVMTAMRAVCLDIQLARRVITRPSASGSEDFDSVTEAQFNQMVAEDRFALYWSAHGLRYGVPETIDDLRRTAEAVLVNLSRAALLQAQEVFGDFRVIHLTAATEVLAQRLAGRGREDAETVARRLAQTGKPLPDGLRSVTKIDNSGALDTAVLAALDVL